MSFELTYTQEQKIKRFCSHYKFSQEWRDFSDESRRNNDSRDVENFSTFVMPDIRRFAENLLCRSRKPHNHRDWEFCTTLCDDPEFDAVTSAAYDLISDKWWKNHG